MRVLPPLAIVFAAILWSADGVLRQSLYAAPSLLIVTLEHAFGTLLFLPALIRHRASIARFDRTTWKSIVWISVFGGILGTFFYTSALGYVNYIELSVVVLLQKLQPFFAIGLSAILLKEKLSREFLLVAFVAFVGAYFVTFPNLSPILSQGKDTIAALLAICAAFCWGTSTVFGKQALNKHSFTTITALRLLITFLVALIPLFALGQYTAIETFASEQWRSLFIIVLTTGSIALAIYYYGLKRVPASHATLYELAWPLSAMLYERVAHGTVLAATQYMGGFFLIAALLLLPTMQEKAARRRSKAAKK